MSSSASRLSARRYYDQYHGHPADALEAIVEGLRAKGNSLIFFAGDSTLDNKFWFPDTADAVNGYEDLLDPPVMKQDVCYHVNALCADRGLGMACVNTAIEATSLSDRSMGRLLEQDRLIQDCITEDDTLVVSVGGNDVALAPLLCTVFSALSLMWCGGPVCCIDRLGCACPPNTGLLGDLGCLCCGVPNCLTSACCGWPVGFGYLVDLFKNRVENYVRRLVAKRKPRRVLVCIVYFLDEKSTGSWADCALSCLCYDCAPHRLQAGIRAAFEHGTRRVRIPGTEVIPVPFFDVLDGKNTEDYCQRVEPSPTGGRKLAEMLVRGLLGEVSDGGSWKDDDDENSMRR